MSTITSSPSPAMPLHLPLPGGAHRRLLAVLAGAVVLFGGGAVASAGASPALAALHLDVAASALQRATAAAGHSATGWAQDADGALLERANCWRQAHRLGQNPSACASAGAADRAR